MKKLLISLIAQGFLFLVVHWIHFYFFAPKIIFTAGIFDILLACTLGACFTIFYTKNSVVVFSCFLILFFGALSYVSLIPTMVDRSITVFILMDLNQAGPEGVSLEKLKQQLKNQRIIDKRFEELHALGIIKIEKNSVFLSKKGRLSADVFWYDMKFLNLGSEYKNFIKEPEPEDFLENDSIKA